MFRKSFAVYEESRDGSGHVTSFCLRTRNSTACRMIDCWQHKKQYAEVHTKLLRTKGDSISFNDSRISVAMTTLNAFTL